MYKLYLLKKISFSINHFLALVEPETNTMTTFENIALSFPQLDLKAQQSTKGGYGEDSGPPPDTSNQPITDPNDPNYLWYWTGSNDPDYDPDPDTVWADFTDADANENDPNYLWDVYGIPPEEAGGGLGSYVSQSTGGNTVFGGRDISGNWDFFNNTYNSYFHIPQTTTNDPNQVTPLRSHSDELYKFIHGTYPSASADPYENSDNDPNYENNDAYWAFADPAEGEDVLGSLVSLVNDPANSSNTDLQDMVGDIFSTPLNDVSNDSPYVFYEDTEVYFVQPPDSDNEWFSYSTDIGTDVPQTPNQTPEPIYRTDGSGVSVSFDNGQNWYVVNMPQVNITATPIHHTVLTRYDGTQFQEQSYDNGKTWVSHRFNIPPPNYNNPPTPSSSSTISSHLGQLSAAMESQKGGAGTVSTGKGDFGGVSYGTFQLSSKQGSVQSFLKHQGSQYASQFAGLTAGSKEFTAVWKSIAASDPIGFEQAQFNYAKANYYDVSRDFIETRTGIDVNTRSEAVQQLIFATSIQFGAQSRIFTRALGQMASGLSDKEIIDRIINMKEQRYPADPSKLLFFKNSSSDWTAGLLARFERERRQLYYKLAHP